MKIQCPNCKASYKIDISKIPAIPEKGFHITCPKCKTRIPVKIEPEPQDETQQETLIVCPNCGHVNISSKLCVSCGSTFTKDLHEGQSIKIDKEE